MLPNTTCTPLSPPALNALCKHGDPVLPSFSGTWAALAQQRKGGGGRLCSCLRAVVLWLSWAITGIIHTTVAVAPGPLILPSFSPHLCLTSPKPNLIHLELVERIITPSHYHLPSWCCNILESG